MATNAQPLGANHALRAALTTLVLAAAAGFLVVSVLGAVQIVQAPISGETGARPVGRFASFALDAETNAAAAFASLLSLASAALALVLARLRPGKIPRWALVIAAAVLAYLALDEWFEVHERLPELFGISRRLYFAPAALVAFAGWFAVWKELRRRRVRTLWLAAPMAWIASQALAEVTWSDGRPVRSIYKPVTAAEEILEMTGSLLFGVALIAVLLALLERREPPFRERRWRHAAPVEGVS